MPHEPSHRSLAANEVLFRAGDSGQAVYIVESGRIEVCRSLPSGELEKTYAGPGDPCGERALLGETRRTTSAVAIEPTVINLLSDAAFADRIARADPFIRHLLLAAIERCDQLRSQDNANTTASQEAGADPSGLQQALELALANDELRLHFQPIIRISDGSVAGFETLLRWQRPGHGHLLLPHEFLWLAEDTGLIVPIGEWLAGVACAALRQFDAINRALLADAAPLFVSINLSPRQCTPALLGILQRELAACRLKPRQLQLEIDEAALVNGLDALQGFLASCKTQDLRLTVDNVGTGPSVLPYLGRLPLDALKLADSLIHDMSRHDSSRTVVTALCRLGADLDLDTVAKGVETAAQHAAVYAGGFRYAQGFHYAPALDFDHSVQFLRDRARDTAASQPYPAEKTSILE